MHSLEYWDFPQDYLQSGVVLPHPTAQRHGTMPMSMRLQHSIATSSNLPGEIPFVTK